MLVQKEAPIYGEYDVAVVGGGVAGIAAALASAESGAKTLLIETQFMLGGLATAGLITYYLPLCDGEGRQLSFGLAEKLLRLSISEGCENAYPSAWLDGGDEKARKETRFLTQFNANVFALLAERELKKVGVEILYGSMVTGVERDEDKIASITVENRSGCSVVKAKGFVDASGDAALCKQAGEETAIYENGNALAAWHYTVENGEYRLNEVGARDTDEAYEVIGLFEGLEAKDLSEVTVYSHQIILDRFLEKGKLSKTHALATVPTIPQVRMTRRLCGKTTLKAADERKTFSGSVGMFGSWRKRGPAYELPFDALCAKGTRNLFVAGRCISVDDELWDLTRVIPVCALSGEAAGIAAAMDKADVARVQSVIRERGGKLHLSEVGITPREAE